MTRLGQGETTRGTVWNIPKDNTNDYQIKGLQNTGLQRKGVVKKKVLLKKKLKYIS